VKTYKIEITLASPITEVRVKLVLL